MSSGRSQRNQRPPRVGKVGQHPERSISVQSARQSSHDPSNRKRVIRMLVVIVLQYFLCWTPLYLLNTWNAIDFRSVLTHISPTTKSLIMLMAYTSSFIHPITYCFMNQNFRRGFRQSIKCACRQSHTFSSIRTM